METVSPAKLGKPARQWNGDSAVDAAGVMDACTRWGPDPTHAEDSAIEDSPSLPHLNGSSGYHRLKIALVSTPFLAVPPHNYGGTELMVYELAEGLTREGHEVVLFATGDSRSAAELRAFYATPQWPPDSFSDLNHASWAMQQIAREDFDVVHAHSSVVLAMGRLAPHVPLVYTLHHPPTAGFSDFYRHFPEVHYIAISERQQELEVKLPSCTVIHHGLDASRFCSAEQAQDYVCFVGRYSDVKGPHTAIDAAQLAGLPIKVAGEVHPPDEAFAKHELFPRLKLPHVTELGCVDVARKVPLLQHARALLAPITWEEPFGLILIEAMLSGCPVVSFPRGSAPELINHGVTGFLVNSLEEMADTIRIGGALDGFDRQLCRREAIKRFGRDRFIAEHLRLYRSAIKAHAAPRRTSASA